MTVAIVIVIIFLSINALSAIDWRSAWVRFSHKINSKPGGTGFEQSNLIHAGLGHGKEAAEYVLAGRTLAGPALLATLAASNLSAFTIFGVSGASYRLGWAFFPVMAFGTAFMAFSFVVIGLPLRRLSTERGWTTPGEFIADRFGSPALGRCFSGLSLLYTIPYLAVQTRAGGQLLAGLTGLPTAAGSALLIGLVAAYVYKGGMRSVVRTDLVQLLALIVLTLAAGAIVLYAAGPSGALTRAAADTARMSHAGVGNTLGWLPLLGYYILWGLADPMFPHFIQRFFAARSDRALMSSMIAYPVVAVLVFLPVCAIGVLGSALVPGLEGSASDNIFRVLTIMLAGPVWGPVFSVAALAALMSTMDSQLLSCASMIGTDVLPVRLRSSGSSASIVLLLAAGAWLVALKPPVSILDFLGKTAFPGYASLAPVAIAGIYAPWLGKRTLSLVLFAGTGLVAIQSAGLLRPPLPAAIFNLGIQTLILCLGAAFLLIGRKIRFKAANPKPIAEYSLLQWVAPLTIGLIGVLGVDFWQYGSVSQLIPGIPRWVAYHAALTLSLSMAFWLYARSRRSV